MSPFPPPPPPQKKKKKRKKKPYFYDNQELILAGVVKINVHHRHGKVMVKYFQNDLMITFPFWFHLNS